MIWKLYKTIALLLLRCCLLACYRGDVSLRANGLLTNINSIGCIIQSIRTYKALHPKFAEQQFGSLDQFLQQQVTPTDWLVWLRLQAPVSTKVFALVISPLRLPEKQ